MEISKPTFIQRLRYRFDSFMSRRGASIFLSLVLVFCVILTFAGIIRGFVYVMNPGMDISSPRDVWTNIYLTFLQMADPGNMALDLEASLMIKTIGILAGIAGMIMFSALIAVITTALDLKIQELKKGHSKVIEEGHTLVLGWNEQRVLEVLRELIEANESEDNPSVVILSDTDKEEMDDYLSMNLEDQKNTRIITRSGSISSLVNLDIVSVTGAKSVVVMSECHDGATHHEKEASDARVIKAILAVLTFCSEDHELNIVAELYDSRNRRILDDVDPERITTLDAQDFLAKIMVQTSRSRGLSMVYSEVLSFHGCELYFYEAEWPPIPFRELACHFIDGIPLGIQHADGELVMKPDNDIVMQPDDIIVILAEDDSTISFNSTAHAAPREDLRIIDLRREPAVEKELILGWTSKGRRIVAEYGDYVLPGSSIDIMINAATAEQKKEITDLDEAIENLEISLIEKDPLDKHNLISVDPAHYDNIIILGENGGREEAEQSDAETLMILLLLRNIFKERGKRTTTKLIAEVLESRNRELVSRAGVDNFVISNQLISMIMAQISEHKEIKKVYEHLFQEEGYEIYIKPASLYLDTFPIDLTFADLMELAAQRNEICLGVKMFENEQDLDKNYGIELNPPKDKAYTFIDYDGLVVLAEDET